jgi:acetyl-CoA carboxylase carboxyl transferase subunit alpha
MALQGALGKCAAAAGRPLGSRTGFSAAPSIAPRGRQLEQLTARFNRNPSPPDAPKDRTPVGREWLETILSRFGPTKERAQNVTTLDFEKPLVELDNRIKEVRPSLG